MTILWDTVVLWECWPCSVVLDVLLSIDLEREYEIDEAQDRCDRSDLPA